MQSGDAINERKRGGRTESVIARSSRVGGDRAGGDDAAADGLADRRGHLHVDSRTLGHVGHRRAGGEGARSNNEGEHLDS